MNPKPLKVLLVEDSVNDAELVTRALRKADFAPEVTLVQTEEEYLSALGKAPIDIILSDFEMPDFSGLHALELLVRSGLKIPFIIVSGSIGEDVAVAAMREGATDYIMKDRMARLGSAVEHALEQYRLQRKAEQTVRALRESEERFREVVETINEVFWVTEGWDGKLLYVSPGYERIWGRPRESLFSPDTWFETIQPEDRARVEQALQARKRTDQFDEVYRIVRPDGSIRWIHDRAFPVRDEHGRVTRIVGVAADITDHHLLEEQLLRTQRLEAIGTLAGGVAHDLNNILAPTLMAADLLKQSITDPHGAKLVEMIEQSMKRGAGIIRQMLVFSRGIEGERASVQPRHLLHEIETLIRETFPRDIELELYVAHDLATVIADATQLHQVLINLCVNARDAMPGGGRLTLTARNVMLETDAVRPREPIKPGWYVLLSVADTGCGIAQEIKDRIFEPFFTTKAVGKGTGLGLSSVLGIAKSHGGFVQLESSPGEGATFNVYIPAEVKAENENTRLPVSLKEQMPRGDGQVVLVVDDEEIIRATTRQLLEGFGYRVLTAIEGKEALGLFKKHQDEIQLVLTDLMMPVMDGAELVRLLRDIPTKLPVIVSSGLLENEKRNELLAMGVIEILAKPYGAKDLLEAVRRQLPESSGRLAPSASVTGA